MGKTYTTKEAAQIIGCAPEALLARVRKRGLTIGRFGPQYAFTEADIAALEAPSGKKTGPVKGSKRAAKAGGVEQP